MKTLITTVLLASSTLVNAKTINLASYEIPYYISSDGNGTFVQLLKEIETRKGIKINLKTYPPSRALQLFHARNETDAYFPSVRPKEENNVLVSDSFYKKYDGIFVRKDYEETNTKNMRVCVTRFYPQENLTHDKVESLKLKRLVSPKDCIKDVLENNSDAFVGEVTTSLYYLSSRNIEGIKILDRAFEKVPVHFLFPNDSKGQENHKLFNEVIKELREENKIQKILNTDKFRELYQKLKAK